MKANRLLIIASGAFFGLLMLGFLLGVVSFNPQAAIPLSQKQKDAKFLVTELMNSLRPDNSPHKLPESAKVDYLGAVTADIWQVVPPGGNKDQSVPIVAINNGEYLLTGKIFKRDPATNGYKQLFKRPVSNVKVKHPDLIVPKDDELVMGHRSPVLIEVASLRCPYCLRFTSLVQSVAKKSEARLYSKLLTTTSDEAGFYVWSVIEAVRKIENPEQYFKVRKEFGALLMKDATKKEIAKFAKTLAKNTKDRSLREALLHQPDESDKAKVTQIGKESDRAGVYMVPSYIVNGKVVIGDRPDRLAEALLNSLMGKKPDKLAKAAR
jgi:protein-disulfide isomerase